MNIVADEALVQGALQGDQEACRRLVETYQRPVYTLILRMVRDPSLAEDLAQEAFLKAFRHLATFDTSRKLSSWLFKIAHNTTLDHLRKNQLDTVSLEPAEGESGDHQKSWADEGVEQPDQRVERRDLAEGLESAISLLSPRYREIIILRYQEGLAYQEIVEILDLPMGTVKTQIHRARARLAQILKDQGWTPDGKKSLPG